MSYNYAESATLTAAASNLVIASDALLASSPDYKIVTLSGAVYSGATVISGGSVTIGRNAALSNSIIGNGGSVFVSSTGLFYGNTIKSGGWVTWAAGQNFPTFSKFTIEAGGTLYLGNGNIYGRNNSIAAGALGSNLSNTSASVNGVLYGVTQKGGAFNYYDIVFSNFVNNGGFTYMYSGCSILDGQAIKAGAGFGLGNSSFLYNGNVTNGSVWIQAAGAVISLGGAQTNITKGHVYHCAAAGTTNQDTDLYAENGVLYGVTLKTNGNWLRDLTIVSGLTISAPVVSNTGKLTLTLGGIAADASVEDGGRIEVRSGGTATGIAATDGATVLLAIAPDTIAQGTKNGYAFNVTGPSVDGLEANNNTWVIVSSGGTAGNLTVNAGASAVFSSGGRGSGVTLNNGGRATMSSGANISGLTLESGATAYMREATVSSLVVKNGGWMSAATAGVSYWGITVEAGGYLAFRATTFTGDINVKSGTLGGFAWVTSDSIDGAAYGMGQNAGAFHFRNARLFDFVNSGACYTYLSSGTVVSNGSAIVAQGGYALCASSYLYNAQVTNGWIWGHQAGANISLGGAETNITKGNWYHCGAGGSSNKDSNLYAENGVLYDATIKTSGNWLRNLTVLEGLTVSRAVMSSGGSLTLVSGGSGNELTVSGYGRLYISSGGVATSAHGKGGMYVYDGGIINSTTIESTGALYVSNGGVANDIAVDSGAKFYVSAGGKVNNLTVSTGQLNADHAIFTGTAEGVNISIYGGKTSGQYCVKVYDNAVLSKVCQSGGGLWVYNSGTVKDLDIVKGEMVFQDNAYGSDVKVSGGTAILYVRNSALVENLHMSGAEARFTAGTIRNASFEGTIGQLRLSNGFLMESASFANGAVMSVCSGGSLNSASVNSHAVILVSNGAEVTNVVVNGDDWNGRLKIYDGGHVSGLTLSGTSGAANYVSMFTGTGVLEDVTTDKAGIYLASGGIIRNLTQKNGAGVILRGENPYASGATVLGGTLYFQNGAKGEDIVVNGGGCNIHDDGYAAEIKGSGAKVSRMDVIKGTVNVSAGAKLFDARISGGTVNVVSTGTTYGVPLISGATLTGGTLNLSAGAAASSIRIDNAGKIFGSGATITDFDIETPNQANGAQLNLSGGAIASGGRVNGKSKVGVVNLTGGAKFNEAYVSGGSVFLSGLAEITNVEQTGGAVILRGEDAYASGATVRGGDFYFQNGAKGDDITVAGGTLYGYDTNMTNPAGSSEVVNDITMTAGHIAIGSGATMNRIAATGGTITIAAGGIGNDVTIDEDAGATVSGTLNVATSAWNVTASNGGIVNVASGATLINAKTVAGAKVTVTRDEDRATFQGSKTNIAANTVLYSSGTVANTLGFSVANGVVKNLGADGKAYRLAFGSGMAVEDATVNNGWRVSAFQDAVVSGGVVNGNGGAAVVVMRDSSYAVGVTLKGNGGAQSGLLNVWDDAVTEDIIVSNGGVLRIQSAGVVASGTVVSTGGKLEFAVGAGKIEDTILKAGAYLTLLEGADTGDQLTFDFTDGNTITVNDLAKIAAGTTVGVAGVGDGAYTLGTAGTLAQGLTVANGLSTANVADGTTFTAAFGGMTYTLDGTTLTTAVFDADVDAAAALTVNGKALNTNDKAATWKSTTTYTGNVFLADDSITGNAWLNLDGFSNSTANIYGGAKDKTFAGVVNINAEAGAIKNLAAGAGVGGKVGGVKLAIGDAMTVTGAVYAGGMGDVTGEVTTQVYGGSFAGNVFAGALCNYAANQTATATGDIALTVNGGTFNNNIYAGAAVKAGAATGVVHTAGDITVELNDGTATKGAFCVYGGGYATGTTTNKVYEAEDVIIGVTGGEWGAYTTGRGIFGGVYADKVAASVDSVAISISGGTVGNVYGGGWAQNGGTSTVGDVTITITGDAEVANVFGGGSYSSNSGGTTEVGAVTILVSGGSIYNNIFAGGQNEFSTVTGDISVEFTGSNDYTCNVYSYGIQTTATDTTDKALFFNGYTGSISGNIGGFDTIAFEGDTAATLSGETIANDDWSFDYTGRTLDATAAMLTLDNGSFAGDSVSVDLSAAEQAANGWSIATGLTAADATYGVELSTGSAANLSLGDTLGDAYGIYEGWGFALEDSTLKFKQLA